MQAGHQEWTKTGTEPKAPVEPSKDAPSMLQATGGYVSSAMSWVAGSLIGKSASSAGTTGTTGTTGTAEAAGEKQPKAVSSSTVNEVLPAIARTELSMEELEHLGEPSKEESTLKHADSLGGDMWGEEGKEETKKSEEGWEDSMDEGNGLKAMGGWDDSGLNFSDEEENKELQKETQNLEMIRQMAEKMKTKNEPPKKSGEGWEDDFGGTKKTQTRTRRATKSAAKPTKISDDDLLAMLNDDKPLPAKKPAAKKESDGWDDDWDDKPASSTKKASSGWDDDWDTQPATTVSKTSKKASNGWDDDWGDDWNAQPATSASKASKKTSDGWDDDWDAKPAQTVQPARTSPSGRTTVRASRAPKESDGWDDDWDAQPASSAKKSSNGWDDDWDVKPASSAKKTSDGWDDDW